MNKVKLPKRVAIVVLNWNGWQDTLVCLKSLNCLDYQNFKVVVVDNGSTDGSVEYIKGALPGTEVLETGSNLGFGGGCNVGIRYALTHSADYVWLINSDAFADRAALSTLVRAIENNVTLGAVGSVLYETESADQVQMWGGGRVNLWLGRSKHRLVPGSLDYISGASMLLRREALEAVGMFDEATFFMYWEDTDISYRLTKAGWKLAVAVDSRIWHKQSASLGKGSPMLDQYFIQSAVRFLKRYAPIPWIAIFLLMCSFLIKRILIRDAKRIQAVCIGFFSA